MTINKNNNVFKAIYGLAIGDALGVPVEFQTRSALKERSVTGYQEGGTHGQPKGTWSDDTSMTLATMDALCRVNKDIDYKEIMENFVKWEREAAYTATNSFFDIGITCQMAISNYIKGNEPTECGLEDEYSCGNGALMRIIPMIFWCQKKYGYNSIIHPFGLDEIWNVTKLTHRHQRCTLVNLIYLKIAENIIHGMDMEESIDAARNEIAKFVSLGGLFEEEIDSLKEIFNKDLKNLGEKEIASGGYCVDTLQATLWCLLNTNSYEECVLKAVNLGHDTDTTAAVAGALAGLYYGFDEEKGIKESYVAGLKNTELIDEICTRFAKEMEA